MALSFYEQVFFQLAETTPFPLLCCKMISLFFNYKNNRLLVLLTSYTSSIFCMSLVYFKIELDAKLSFSGKNCHLWITNSHLWCHIVTFGIQILPRGAKLLSKVYQIVTFGTQR